jgi:hypothetical protein
MVRDQVLRLTHQGGQLVHLAVAASQLAQQPPPDGMAGQAQEYRRREFTVTLPVPRSGAPPMTTGYTLGDVARGRGHPTSTDRRTVDRRHRLRSVQGWRATPHRPDNLESWECLPPGVVPLGVGHGGGHVGRSRPLTV